MPKVVAAVLTGLVTAILISAGLNLLLASAGVAPMASAQTVGLGVGTFVAWGIMNAGVRKRAPKADAAEKAAALGSAPPPGAARLTVFRDGAVGKGVGTDVFLDGEEKVQLQGGQFMSLTLAPGRRTVRVALAGRANARSKPAETVLDLVEGTTTALKVTLAMKLTTSEVALAQVDAATAARTLSGRTMVTVRADA